MSGQKRAVDGTRVGNFRDHGQFQASAWAGSRLAYEWLWSLLVPSFLSGCLITNPVEFEQEENVPPVIVDAARSDNPIGSILEVDFSAGPGRIAIPVRVRDENLFEDLVARIRVVTLSVPEPDFLPVDIPEQGELMRDLTVFVESGEIAAGECQQLELVVSGSFVLGEEPDLFDVVIEPGDIGRASWTIWEVSLDPKAMSESGAGAAQNLVLTCPTQDALVVEGMEQAQ
jgi:hypothetical protein